VSGTASLRARLMNIARRIVKGPPPRMHEYRLTPDEIAEAARGQHGDLARIFFGPKERTVTKWLHYLSVYERHFAAYRNREMVFLEIGVYKGGSLEMWRRYFGEGSSICGIDVDPACAGYESPGTRVRIGSQDDPAFLKRVVAEIGPPDIILDDGSHIARHQRTSFDTLFPLLKDGGLYVIEDLHTAYWGNWGGGYRRKGTAIERVKDMIDDLHAWYHDKPTTTPAKTEIEAIHIYDSMVFIEKKRKARPAHIVVPGSADTAGS
jgi:hypothetical protein